MRKSSLLSSVLFPGFASYVERNKCDPQIGADSQKGPPEIESVELAYLNASNRTIKNDGASNYINSSMLMGKVVQKPVSPRIIIGAIEFKSDNFLYQVTKSDYWLKY